jgi:hypothetical protein
MPKLHRKYFHLVFSMVMGAKMVFVMTFFITWINLGWVDGFFLSWMRAYLIAYVIAVPVIYFLAPLARRFAARWVETP